MTTPAAQVVTRRVLNSVLWRRRAARAVKAAECDLQAAVAKSLEPSGVAAAAVVVRHANDEFHAACAAVSAACRAAGVERAAAAASPAAAAEPPAVEEATAA